MDAAKTFQKMAKMPLGKFLFSKLVCQAAPYFGSISPRIEVLEPQRCVVTMQKRRKVTNHFKTIHAIAMCNMAELAAGMMTDASIPKGARWIPAGMTVRYLKKAKSDLTATADGSEVDWTREGSVQVPVSVIDTLGEEVFCARVEMNIKH